MLGGVVLIAVAIIAVAIAISSGGSKTVKPNSAAAKQAATSVSTLLTGIPQSGLTLGNPNAKVTITEFGDLECPICAEFATTSEKQLINNYVRTGKAKLVYRSLCTATCNGPGQGVFDTQQVAASAAGSQNKAWDYILLFYNEQGQEGSGYVTESYLSGLASQIPGLNLGTWQSDRKNPTISAQIAGDLAFARSKGWVNTPTVIIKGPKGEQDFTQVLEDYGTYQSAINTVS
jgi:protein-disulfide isomerase